MQVYAYAGWVLTGHPVDGPKRTQYSDRADGGEAYVLEVERIFQHSVKTDKQ